MLSTVKLLICTFILQVNGQSNCADYSVSVDQDTFLVNKNVTLTCTYINNPVVETIGWEAISTTGAYQPAYTYYGSAPDSSGPTTGFTGRLDGNMTGTTHTLTIVNANRSDDMASWRCTVNTADCSFTNRASLEFNLTEPYVRDAVIQVVIDGEDVVKPGVNLSSDLKVQTRSDVDVTCHALSDPASTVSMENVKTVSPQSCERVSDLPLKPWNCSVNGTISKYDKGWKKVSCPATIPATPDVLTEVVNIKILWQIWEICVLTIGILLIIVVAIGAVVVLNKKMGKRPTY